MKPRKLPCKKGQVGLIALVVILVIGGIVLFSGGSDAPRPELKEGESNVKISIDQGDDADDAGEAVVEQDTIPPTQDEGVTALAAWRDITLTNVHDDSTYSFNTLSDKPVIVESFAVWCPICTKQQRELKELHEDPDFGDKFYSIGLDTDQNEDAATVLDHASKNGFDWRYSVSPVSLTNALVDEFGISVVNAPSAPVILICQDGGQTYFLDRGVKTSDEIKQEIQTKCGI